MAGIASIPGRAAQLEIAVRSLAPQVDRVFVSMNDYAECPEFLNTIPNVSYRGRGPGNGGDAEKFAEIDRWEGVVVAADDDLAYPPDYVEKLLDGLSRWGVNHIVGFHGGETRGYNDSAIAATHRQIRCLGALTTDDPTVNVLGTGALAFDTRAVPLWRGVFRHPNCADVQLACHAHRFGIPMVALAHDEGWIHYLLPENAPTIYGANVAGDGSERDTRAARKEELDRVNWTVQPSRPRVRVSIATCERPALLADLLGDVDRDSAALDLEVCVYEDPSGCDYSEVRAWVEQRGWQWRRFPERLGKDGHAELVAAEIRDGRDSSADWFVFLPDDVRLVRHAISRAIDAWDRLDDPATLTLWRLKDHEGMPNWTGLFPVEREHGWEVFHVDGIYLSRRDLLDFVSQSCPTLTAAGRRRRRAGSLPRPGSSGVGRSMSLTLHRAGRRMYRVSESLALPVPNVPSVMNPDATDRFYPGVVAA